MRTRKALLLAGFLLTGTQVVSAQQVETGAKVSEPMARRTALAAVRGGAVEKFELEREGGKLIYSYDIKVAGKDGIEEVHIDAITGRMLSKDHESSADEAKEADEVGEADEAGEANEAGEADEAGESDEMSDAALQHEARITEWSARRSALAAVTGGTVEKFELEREGGKLLYSYDIKVAGKSGIDEVQIDAMTGELLSNMHETPADEAKEADEDMAALQREAKITEVAARRTALAAVPGGTVEKFDLEREDGKLLYSYDIKIAGKAGIEEVHVDALTGLILSNEHESPEAEAKEGDGSI